MDIKILNYTPHDINIYEGDNLKETLHQDGIIRLKEENILIGYIGKYPVYSKQFSIEDELPPEKDGVVYIVSSIVATAFKNKRNDLYVVNETVRNSSNQICGCKSFAKI